MVVFITTFVLDYYIRTTEARANHICARKGARIIILLALAVQLPIFWQHAGKGGDRVLLEISTLIHDSSLRTMLLAATVLFMFSIVVGAMICHTIWAISKKPIGNLLLLKLCYIGPPAIAGLCLAIAQWQ